MHEARLKMRVLSALAAAAACTSAALAQRFGGEQLHAGVPVLETLPADLTGDGVLDLLVVSHTQLRVLVGGGNSEFAIGASSPFGVANFSATNGRLVHLNSDGLLDVIVGGVDNPSSLGRYVVMLGQGGGTFQLHSAALFDCELDALAVGDVDHDGDIDVVAPTYCPPGFYVFVNNGAGVLSAGALVPSTGTRALQLADFNGDGELDVALGGTTAANSIAVHLGIGGSFGPPTTYALSKATRSLASGDIDGDGDIDLVALTGPPGSHRLVKLLNSGAGAFTATNGAFFEFDRIALGDFDGDGALDVAGSIADACAIARNLGGGDFVRTHSYVAGRVRSAPTLCHVDADGWLDLLLGSDADVTWLRGLGACALDGGEIADDTTRVNQAAAADLDGDGVNEIVLVTPLEARVMRHVGFGQFQLGATSALPFTAPYPGTYVELGDVDGDGKLDGVFSNYSTSVVWTPGDGLGGLGAAQPIDTSSGTGVYVASSIAVGDVDGDGLDDVVATPGNWQSFFTVVRSLGNGAFAAPQSVATPYGAREIRLGDLDGDGRADVVLRTTSANLLVLRSLPGGGFGPPMSYPLPSAALRPTLGDVDGDQKLDVILGLAGLNAGFATLLGDGLGRFGAPVLSGPGPAFALALVDLDQDGRRDVIGYSSQSFTCYRGNGAGAFTPVGSYASGYSGALAGAPIAEDVNADGALDVLVPSPSLSVHLQHANGAMLGVYCTPKTNSLGCSPRITSVGVASAFATSGFLVRSDNVINSRVGLCFYGFSGAQAASFAGGTLCVRAPLRRCVPRNSGGNAPPVHDCSGAWSIDMNAFASALGGGNPSPALGLPGTHVFCQWWGRDGGFLPAENAQLSDALHYVVLP